MDRPIGVFRAFLDTLFPKREDAALVEKLDTDALRTLLLATHIDGTVALLPFSDERVRACIHETKFHENRTAMRLLARVLYSYLATHHSHEALIIPVPLSPDRQRERGYNQVERIVSAGEGTERPEMVSGILVREKDTVPQTSLPRKERLKNVAEAFAVRDPERARAILRSRHVILLDDVTTTGATLKAAKAALSPLTPASITCVALAH